MQKCKMVSNGVLEFVREDDYIEYYLFPRLEAAENSQNEELNEILVQVEGVSEAFCRGYIWHRDAFRVRARPGNAHLLIDHQGQTPGDVESLPAHLYGISHYGDNIEDEWFIVALLYELTRQIPGLVVRTVDGDGEFLLIEVANHLPNWANPDTCHQCVFIADGALHLIRNDAEDTPRAVTESVTQIRSDLSRHRVSNEIENSILRRTGSYPARIAENLHRATAYVPVGVAALLRHKPTLIASAIREFCSRDAVDMKVCRAMRFFPPENRVYTRITFTKCLYAMLMHSSYTPDRRTGWNLPNSSSKSFPSHSLGMKIACGFEILASQAKPEADFNTNRHWIKYVESLREKGYFQDFLEGSKDHTRLIDAAKDYYRTNIIDLRENTLTGQQLLDDLKSIDLSIDEFKKLEPSLPPNDDESWLNIAPEELDKMLQDRYGDSAAQVNGDCEDIAGKLSEFLAQKSSAEGVEVESTTPPIRPQRGVKKAKGKVQFASTAAEDTVDFDPDAFQSHVKNLLDLVIPEDKWDDSNSDMSDYGDDTEIDRNIDEMNIVKTETNLDVYMKQMDKELAKTTIGESFEKKTPSADDAFDDIEDFTPVDIDLNTLKNMMESYQAQLGSPGPASNLLGSMGVRLKPPGPNQNTQE
ncbi:protein ecdysoneless [Phlebotomus argentipes]|uniref:protein ecdysoneless n=1 Tax=Phlebotomus argentipes TaxID=94469 RepID=UPI002892EACF|nr:protein ecdysoneless [Phlebotomus argentipes]